MFSNLGKFAKRIIKTLIYLKGRGGQIFCDLFSFFSKAIIIKVASETNTNSDITKFKFSNSYLSVKYFLILDECLQYYKSSHFYTHK